MYNPISTQAGSVLKQAIEKTFPHLNLSLAQIASQINPAPNFKFGHLAFPCFPLGKALKSSPPLIANQLVQEIQLSMKTQRELPFQTVKAVGPYINFFISSKGVGEQLIDLINQSGWSSRAFLTNAQTWMIEYSQPNTHKVLHVGHMRNLCLGNALVEMARYAGQKVIAVTYPGDVGTHVAKCLWYLEYHYEGEIPQTQRGAWLGEIYFKAHELLKEQKQFREQDQINREALTEILTQIHDQKGPFFKRWKETRHWSIELMKEIYDWAHVKFDRWFWESEMDAPSLKWAHELHSQKILTKDQGAIGMDLKDEKLGFCLLVKSDGTGLYATKDIQLAKIKFEEFGVDTSIYIVDDRQAHHFKQVFKVLEKIGFPQAKKCRHLPYNVVELPGGPMSSREGNIIPLTQLIEMMEQKIKEKYLQKYLDDPQSGWTKKEVEQTAQMIANGAIKYGMIRIDNNRKIIFNMDEWLKLDGETGPYLQYAHARIQRLLQKLGDDSRTPVDWSLLKLDCETALLVKIIFFKDVVASGVQRLQTMHLCTYLYELAKLFNAFYAEAPMAQAQSPELKNTRLALARAVGFILSRGLKILGIPAPFRM